MREKLLYRSADSGGRSWMTVNDTTNSLTTKIIFGNNRKPQDQFNYRFMGEVTPDCEPWTITEDMVLYDHLGDENFTLFNKDGKPVFPGYTFEGGKSIYRRRRSRRRQVMSMPTRYVQQHCIIGNCSMHPSSIGEQKNIFGPEYTRKSMIFFRPESRLS